MRHFHFRYSYGNCLRIPPTLCIIITGVALILPQLSWLVRFSSSSEADDERIHKTDIVVSWQYQNKTVATATAIGACSGYDGVLHIASGDREGAAGTIFFLFVVNQLIYADMHNLLPWVHLNNVSQYVYDDAIHGSSQSFDNNVNDFEMLCGKVVSWESFTDLITNKQHRYPGKPQRTTASDLAPCRVSVEGNGVWNSYFEPVSQFSPTDSSCTSLPLLRMSYSQIIPSLHVFAPWSVRAWRYGGLPPSLRKHNETYQEWFAPMRQRGHAIVAKYVRILPHLKERATTTVHNNAHNSNCMALHIRHSDKANRRQRIPVERFLPYAEAYYNYQIQQQHHNQSRFFCIYLATDSTQVIKIIHKLWPPHLQSVLRWQQGTDMLRSNDTTAVFRLFHNRRHHDTNVQVLTDIWAMSRCQYLVHGLSAVSEAVHYLNPSLHRDDRSVNLDDRKKDIVTVEQFQGMLLQQK